MAVERERAADAPLPSWLSGAPGRWLLALRVQPAARGSGIVGEHGGALKLRIAAPAIEGRANEALLGWIAHRLGVPARDVSLASGAGARAKRVRVSAAIDAAQVLERLGANSR